MGYHRILGRVPCANILQGGGGHCLFVYRCPIAPAPFVEKAIFYSIEFLLHFCKESVGHIYWGLFLGSLFCSIDLFVCLSAKTTRLDYYKYWNWVDWLHPPYSFSKKKCLGTSLLAQWLRICLPMQGTRVRALVREDPTCRGATKPVRHNYWACALEPMSHNYWAHVLQLLKPAHLEPVLRNKRSHRNEKPAHRDEE